jgi:hypothetical protein
VGQCYPEGDPGCGERRASVNSSAFPKKTCTRHEDVELRWLIRQELLPLSGPSGSSVGTGLPIEQECQVPPLSATQGDLPNDGCIHTAIWPIPDPYVRGSKCFGTETFLGSASVAADQPLPPEIWPRTPRDGRRALTLECTVRPRGSLVQAMAR